jgi:predicted nucleic-acid-binding Zn-ribbon protein
VKSTSICPKCGGRKVYAVPVQQTYCDAGGTLRAFHLTGGGPMSAFVCAACGYTEWYMPGSAMKLLARMLAAGVVSVVEHKAERDPFR